jgi:zinc and cadmium transporter
MFELVLILLSTLMVSLISIVGIFFVTIKEELFKKILLLFVSFASGTLLGAAFLELIPESLSASSENVFQTVFVAILVGILAFFILEKSLWRHCHERECPIHTFAYLNLLGDGVHNFIDGVIIAASFLVPPMPNISLGVATTLAVIAHEIPQEIGDFSILIYGGFSKIKALSYNFLTATIAIFAAALTYFFSAYFPSLEYLLAFAAGGFIYIATTDLIPEMHKEQDLSKSIAQFVLLSLGMVLMWALKE